MVWLPILLLHRLETRVSSALVGCPISTPSQRPSPLGCPSELTGPFGKLSFLASDRVCQRPASVLQGPQPQTKGEPLPGSTVPPPGLSRWLSELCPWALPWDITPSSCPLSSVSLPLSFYLPKPLRHLHMVESQLSHFQGHPSGPC